MKKKSLGIGLIILLAIMITIISWQYFYPHQENRLVLYGNVDIRTVNLGFRVSGRLAALNADEGDVIQVGKLLGKLDDAPYINALNEAKANALAAKAQLDLLQAGYRDEEIAQVRSAVAQQQALYNYADTFLRRQRKLWAEHLISANDLDNAISSRNQAKSNLQAAKDKLKEYQKGNRPQQIENAQAQLAQAQAAVDQAELNLKDTQLIAPSNGTILTRAVEPGSMLSVGATVFNLSLTRPVWIRAYINESDLNQAIPNRRVEIYTDGRPDTPYHGKIGFISPTAEFTPKSVETPDLRTELVYRLRIIVTDPDDSLRQGMPVTLHIGE